MRAVSQNAQMRPDADLLLEVSDLVVEFPTGHGNKVHAVSSVSFDIVHGETLGLVGESGCGKSTTGLAVMQLVQPNAGTVRFDGQDLTELKGEDLRAVRPKFQMIFQDPLASLNPRRRIRNVVAEPLQIWPELGEGSSDDALVAEVMEAVGLDLELMGNKKPRAFSGGQAQRIAIARALILEPKLLVCDEPVASLDVSVQGQILNLLASMKARYGLTMLFIAHDLAVIKNVSDRLAVMYLGRLCEIGNADSIYDRPAHHYTRALLDAVPRIGGESRPVPLAGEVPSPSNPPSGCRFRTRCPAATELCALEVPVMRPVGDDHFVACHHPLEASVPVAPPAMRVAQPST